MHTYIQADVLFRKAIDCEPGDAGIIGTYASFVAEVCMYVCMGIYVNEYVYMHISVYVFKNH